MNNYADALNEYNSWTGNQTDRPNAQSNKPKSDTPADFTKFSLKNHSREMEKRMLKDKFILGRIAILGQATAIYAKPNTGKTLITLRLLIDAIQTGDIDGENVFYVNADDSYKGLVHKTKLGEQYGFHMLAPGQNGFESRHLLEVMEHMTKENTASGVILILDTLKKFCDLMDKRTASGFMRVARAFVTAGGSLILLAHTNKNRDSEGKVVFGGTSDIVDDVDCGYTLDEVSCTKDIKRVLFENIKARGDVTRSAGYEYSTREGQSYSALLDSVQPLDEQKAEAAKREFEFNERLLKDELIIEAIADAIQQGVTLKTELIAQAHMSSGSSKKAVNKVLAFYEGTDKARHRWQSHKTGKIGGGKEYRLFSETRASDYSRTKDGE